MMSTATRPNRPKHRRFKRGQQMGRLSISLDPDLLARVQRLSDATGKTYSEVAAKLVEDGIAALEVLHAEQLERLPPPEVGAD